jgi:hypothetical protein
MESTQRYSRSTAYHEAGHAVVAFALGLLVGTIRVRADDAGGTTEIEPADHLSLIDQIALCLAGTAAEKLFDCRSHDWAFSMDILKIMELIRGHGMSEETHGPGLRAAAYNWALTHLQKHRSKVAKLADRLVECGRVDPVEFMRLTQDQATP